MLTTDAAGGFRQLHHFRQFRLAVSRSDQLRLWEKPVAKVCPPPPGWRIATSAELRAAGLKQYWQHLHCPESYLQSSEGRVGEWPQPEQLYYRDQAGWDRCTWEGVARGWFVTADWARTDSRQGGALHAGHAEGNLVSPGQRAQGRGCCTTAATLRGLLPNRLFAGAVCVRDA